MKVRDWFVVYHDRQYRLTRFLKPGFRHVELTRPEYFGPGPQDCVWLNVLPTFETLDVELSTDPRPPWVRCPNATVQKVTTIKPYYRMRSWFDMGPPTCVEIAKMALGIRAFWVRTPRQLFNYIQRRGGVIDSAQRRR